MVTGKKRKNLIGSLSNNKCEACGYDEFIQILTLHHIYPKRDGKQPDLSRPLRYLVLCPNCHQLVELGLINVKKIHVKNRKQFTKPLRK